MLSVGTWNIRTLREVGKMQLLKAEARRYKCDILGISEIKRTELGKCTEEGFHGQEANLHVGTKLESTFC